jgi:hypothetical protein
MPPGKKKTSPVVWILLIVGGLFLMGIAGVVGLGFWAAHKVKQAGLDPDLWKNNPGLAVTKMITTFNPELEVLGTDDSAGTITVRNRKTNEVVKLRFDDVKNGKFNMHVQADGKDADVSFGDVSSKLPSWVPKYPGASMNAGFSATSSGSDGEGGTFSFTTSDSADKVKAFYEEKGKDAGMTTETAVTPMGSTISLTDTSNHHTIAATMMGTGPTTVTVVYSSK